jgi:hypothetical protein
VRLAKFYPSKKQEGFRKAQLKHSKPFFYKKLGTVKVLWHILIDKKNNT